MQFGRRLLRPGSQAPSDGAIVALSKRISTLLLTLRESRTPSAVPAPAAQAMPTDSDEGRQAPQDPAEARQWRLQTISALHAGATKAIEAAADELASLIDDCRALAAPPPIEQPALQPDPLARPLAA